MNREIIEDGVRKILEGIGEDVTRPGLVDTPKRVAKLYEEALANTGMTNAEIAKKYGKCFSDAGDGCSIVTVRDIPAFSYCEHHIALMYDMRVSVSYIPCGKVIGLSKQCANDCNSKSGSGMTFAKSFSLQQVLKTFVSRSTQSTLA